MTPTIHLTNHDETCRYCGSTLPAQPMHEGWKSKTVADLVAILKARRAAMLVACPMRGSYTRAIGALERNVTGSSVVSMNLLGHMKAMKNIGRDTVRTMREILLETP